jgi:hypothetical protein
VLIGGTGERRTVRLVAEYGDACNFFDIPDGGQTLRHKFEVLAAHCATVGRRYDDIERTVTTALLPDESAEHLVPATVRPPVARTGRHRRRTAHDRVGRHDREHRPVVGATLPGLRRQRPSQIAVCGGGRNGGGRQIASSPTRRRQIVSGSGRRSPHAAESLRSPGELTAPT